MLNHKGSTELKSERLLLRAFRESDAEQMFYNWANDPEVARYMSWEAHKNIDETRRVIAEWIASSKNKNNYNWIIEYQNEPAGSISVVSMNEPCENCEIGYCIAKDLWGQGITSEAVERVIRFLFDEIGFHRIFAKHDIENIGSGRVMQKCGMQFEGLQREAVKRKNGTFGNFSVYAILKKDKD